MAKSQRSIEERIVEKNQQYEQVMEKAKQYQDIRRVQEIADSVFGGMLSNFAVEMKENANSILYLNMRNPIIRKMLEVEDGAQLEDMIVLLYVQTLLIGGFPLRNNEMGIMNEKLLHLIERALD